MEPGITTVIPTIPIRAAWLGRALESVDVASQALHVRNYADRAIIVNDENREGSAATRNRGLFKVQTEWTAFLDDDDEMLPFHLSKLWIAAQKHDADVVYSLPKVLDPGGREIPRQHDWGGGPVFDPEYLRRKAHIQTTCLVRTELAQRVGGFEFVRDETGASNDDHGFFLRLLDAGARFHHVHEQTFIWHHHGRNTSGRPDRW